jgi:putative endonuclease
MFHVYVLRSESTGRYYTGSTGDLARRLTEHNTGLATATRHWGPWRLVYHEEHPRRGSAIRREQYLKTGRGRDELRRLMSEISG